MATDVSGFDPITVSLRDYIDGSHEAHENAHARERESVQQLLDQHDKLADRIISDHFTSHDAEHAAVKLAFENHLRELTVQKTDHAAIHEKDTAALRTALDAVERLAALHATAHEREHQSHETVHQREREAAGLARVDLDARLKELADQRQQLREQTSSFMPRTEIMALLERGAAATEAQAKSADGAHSRMDTVSAERFAVVQSQIDKLNLAAAANSGASQRTTFLIGFGFTFITIIVAIVGVYLSSKGR